MDVGENMKEQHSIPVSPGSSEKVKTVETTYEASTPPTSSALSSVGMSGTDSSSNEDLQEMDFKPGEREKEHSKEDAMTHFRTSKVQLLSERGVSFNSGRKFEKSKSLSENTLGFNGRNEYKKSVYEDYFDDDFKTETNTREIEEVVNPRKLTFFQDQFKDFPADRSTRIDGMRPRVLTTGGTNGFH